MKKNDGCITFPLVPGRKEPSDKSEMVTQLLFGEFYSVLETQRNWVLIENEADQYECWIDKKQHTPISQRTALDRTVKITMDTLQHGDRVWSLPAGSKVKEGEFNIEKKVFSYMDYSQNSPSNLTEYALQFIGAPYLWGGKSILGIDCSGLVQVVFSCHGIQMPRDAYQQAEIGETVDFVETAQPGDLAYFDNEEGRITHVGIMLDGGSILHASGSVRIDPIDHAGIYHSESQSYTHKLRIVKRVLPQ